jgi:hypothetical protein
VLCEADVLVVGGGCAGVAAAIGAAQAGATVVLAEHYGFLGGHATAALAVTIASYYTSPPINATPKKPTLFPTDHGAGHPIIGGVLTTLVDRLVKAGGAVAPSPQTGFVVPVDPEVYKAVALEMVLEAGVKLFFHVLAIDFVVDSAGVVVVFASKEGLVAVKAKVVVDCTGDGDVAAWAGAEFEVGRESDGKTQPMSLLFIVDGFDRTEFDNYVRLHPDHWSGVQGLKKLVDKATAKGDLKLTRENILFFGMPRPSQINVNSTRITDVNGLNVSDLTHAEIEGHKQMSEIMKFLQKYVPGFGQAYISQSAIMMGVRETRRIIGEYKLTAEDVLEGHHFPDAIAHGSYPIDMHNPTGKGTVLKKIKAGEAYDIPLRCLIPTKTEHLLVAGRCISGTHEAQSSYRVIPISIATGQAAGVCAALTTKKGLAPRKVPYLAVQMELRRQGAVI